MIPKCSIKLVSSLEKCFLDETIASKKERNRFLMYRNEKLSFQLLIHNDEDDHKSPSHFRLSVEGALAPYVQLREMVCVPNHYPACPASYDDNYLRTAPGLYPDLLRPIHNGGYLRYPCGQLRTVWVDVQIPEDAEVPTEETALTFALSYEYGKDNTDEVIAKCDASVRVSPVKLPAQKLIHTEWFYTDTIAELYHTEVWSEKHWEMIEKYIKVAVDNGINMILTPVFTPELDTYVGGERLTTQLVKITVTGQDTYAFDFGLLDRWVDMCERLGVKYFEIPHFFSQWGAKAAPKFVAAVDGEERRIFGWETDSLGDEYRLFLAQFVPALVAYCKARGIDKRCYYHISDEPSLKHLEHYLACKERVAPYLEGYAIIDALSSIEFYGKGVLKKPVPSIDHVVPFIEQKVEGLWTYYAGAGGATVRTDRYLAMPTARTRILGVQLYLYHIEGFLHWGYNCYHSCGSYDVVNPLGATDGETWAPAGDSFLVYPGTDGTVWESIRLNAMREAMDDIRALELCESVLGRERTEELISVGTTEPLTFFAYPKDSEYLLSLHDRVLLAIEESIQ